MSRWNADFLDLLTALNAADARYLLVGGHAVGLFALPRATKDFDLWVEASRDNATRVISALRTFGAPMGALTTDDLASPGNGFRMGDPPYRIEVLTMVSGLEFANAWPRRQQYDLDGVPCYVIALDDLIANKRAAGRPQDLADLHALLRAKTTK